MFIITCIFKKIINEKQFFIFNIIILNTWLYHLNFLMHQQSFKFTLIKLSVRGQAPYIAC